MNTSPRKGTCWRQDLEASRNFNARQKHGFLMVLAWFENFRLRLGLPPARESAVRFWKQEVLNKEKTRESWQLEQWGEAISWYLGWLAICQQKGIDGRSLPERMRNAADSAGMRRGLARRTRQSYGGWIARYGLYAKEARKAMQPETASAFLGWVVKERQCSYATQKIALNSLVFFFRDVCGFNEVRFDVRLRKTPKRIPTVLSQSEIPRLFSNLESRYLLPARLQYGSGLRLGELVNLRIKDLDLERGLINIRGAKGDKDRTTMIPESLKPALANHLIEINPLSPPCIPPKFVLHGLSSKSKFLAVKKATPSSVLPENRFRKMPVRNLRGQSIRPKPRKALFPSRSKADKKSRCNSNPWAPTARPLHGIVRKPTPSSPASPIRWWSRNMLDLETCRLSV